MKAQLQDAALAVLLTGISGLALAADSAGQDHSMHGSHQHSMTPEQFAELREKIEVYRGFSDEQIVESMSRMRSLGGMISEADVKGNVGVLALAHGYSDQGNEQWLSNFEEAADKYPIGYGLGMAMMGGDHIQQAIDGLEAAGAETIIVLRTETGDANSLNYQWEYLFGRRDEAAYLTAPRVKSQANIIWGPSPTAHPIMGEIMLQNALELSSDPANEMVVILGHGAMTPKENELDLATLDKHAKAIKNKGGFAEVKYWNVQDDLPADKRAANVQIVRDWIAEAKQDGRDVIVITNVLTQSGIMKRLENDVADTGAKFNDAGLMQSPRFADWIQAAIDENMPQ